MLSDKNNENVFQSRCNVFCTLMAGLDGLNGLNGLDGLDGYVWLLGCGSMVYTVCAVGLHRRFLSYSLYIYSNNIYLFVPGYLVPGQTKLFRWAMPSRNNTPHNIHIHVSI